MTRGDPDHLSIVIHEIRNPLVGIDAAARILATELGSHPSAKRATAISAEARLLLGMLESVADAEAASAGRLRSALAPVDLARCVRDAVAAIHLDGHPVSVTGAEMPVTVRADEGRLRQVLRNLLVNAAQYSPPGSPIDVSLAVDPRRRAATVRVRDHGPGIPPAERRKLFRKFSRLSTAAETRGSGLGLYICKAIVEDHGGTLRLDRESGRGSSFSFAIPVEGARARTRSRVVERSRARERSRAGAEHLRRQGPRSEAPARATEARDARPPRQRRPRPSIR